MNELTWSARSKHRFPAGRTKTLFYFWETFCQLKKILCQSSLLSSLYLSKYFQKVTLTIFFCHFCYNCVKFAAINFSCLRIFCSATFVTFGRTFWQLGTMLDTSVLARHCLQCGSGWEPGFFSSMQIVGSGLCHSH